MKTKAKRAASAKKEAKRLPPEKSREVVGIVLLVTGAILLVSVLTYHPLDPSFLNPADGDRVRIRNWIGPVGAQLAALTFEFVGLVALLVPVFFLVGGWRRVRHRDGPKVIGRGVGVGVVLLCLPPLLQIALGEIEWRGEAVWAGGGLGRLFADAVGSQLGQMGAVVVFLGGVVVGFALLIQSTLGEILARWNRGLKDLGQRIALVWSRNRERRGKDKARRRVMEKQLERAARKSEPEPAPAADAEPVRVVEKQGRGKFSVRKVTRRAPEPTAESRTEEPKEAQKEIPFPKPAKGTSPLPPLDLLDATPPKASFEEDDLVRLGEVIRTRCAEFGVEGTIEGISPGPVITVFEFQPAPGVKVSQIVNLQDDLALALKAESVRIDRIPGRSTLGIEVPNRERATIRLGYMLSHKEFRKSSSRLTMAIGMTIHGEPYFSDLRTMPHLLVAGATGSGKSVGLQAMITSILMQATREEVQFIFIDPKRIELGVYKEIPHLKTEVVVEPQKAANALRWAVSEMERRYRLLAEVHVRSIAHYNQAIRDPELKKRLALSEKEEDDTAVEELKPLPYYVVVIDELADLMLSSASEVETAIARLAQMARAVGIHMIVATQRPSVDVLTGTIKANFPCRISFATASRHDSRTILDSIGAEHLLGKGDMLFMPPGTSRILRLHGPYVSEQETAALIRWLKRVGKPELDPEVLKPPADERGTGGPGDGGGDELYDEAARLVVSEGQGSASFLQRRLRVGFSRAARLIDMMEADGLLGPPQGSKPRDVLVKPDFFEEWDEARRDVEG
ncbi:MAG: DNA translocase FtsK 4TM domain-containing protein [Thermoanaerobaculia bacterium]|nr:DNA translocase FtsK 4TM domain-containing protein [Thermoanaerobaculia bacterium]